MFRCSGIMSVRALTVTSLNEHSLLFFGHSLCRLVSVFRMCGISVFQWGSCWEGNTAPAQTWNTNHTHTLSDILAWKKWPAQTGMIDDEWIGPEWRVMDGDVKTRVEKKDSRIQSADQWKCHAFLKSAVWPYQRDRPGKGCDTQPVRKHRSELSQPSGSAPGTPVWGRWTKLRGKKEFKSPKMITLL